MLSASKTSAGKAAWFDSVSIKELVEDVKLSGENMLSSKNSWTTSPKGNPVKPLDNGSLEIISGSRANMLISCRIKLAPSNKWRFSADMSVKGSASVVLPDGKKVLSHSFVDFTTPEKEGFTTLRFWIPAQQPGSKIVISNIRLHKIENQ